jgi:hypothetical protein
MIIQLAFMQAATPMAYSWNRILRNTIMPVTVLPIPMITNNVIPGIRKLVKGPFFRVSTDMPKGESGLIIASYPPSKPFIPTTKWSNSIAVIAFFTQLSKCKGNLHRAIGNFLYCLSTTFMRVNV